MSTEFSVGHEKISSKVLKPPGGGSSDIFGTGTSTVNQDKGVSSTTKNRLFGSETSVTPKKVYIPRNPVTGEGMAVDSEEISQKEKDDECGEKEAEKELKTESVVEGSTDGQTHTKAIPSIRVRQPPGGTSSIRF